MREKSFSSRSMLLSAGICLLLVSSSFALQLAGADKPTSPATQATAPAASEMATSPTAASALPPVKVGTTQENLMAAFNGESNAHAKYLAYAKKADEEGYKSVASLFRATAKAEEIHAANHARVIKKLGGTPKAEIKLPEIKSTRDNLTDAIKGETYESIAMYPAFLKKAREDKNADAVLTLNQAKTVEQAHAKYYRAALAQLDKEKNSGPAIYFVCPVCGETVSKADFTFAKCPVCFTPKEKFMEVK